MPRVLLLGGLLYAWFLIGLLTQRGELLALSIPIAVYLASAFLKQAQPPDVKVQRSLLRRDTPADALTASPASPSAEQHLARVRAGEHLEVQLSISNQGRRLDEVLIEDLLPPGLRLAQGSPRWLLSLPAGATVDLGYALVAARGEWDLPGLRAIAVDPAGLTRAETTVSAHASLAVMPAVARVDSVLVRPRHTRYYAGPVPARLGGSGAAFFSVREYQPGDPRRWIDWRASERHTPDLYTRQFEQERVADIGIIVDARQRRDIQPDGASLFEHSVQAAASLADSLLRDGNRVGLLIYGWHLAWTYPGYGKVQRERILAALARARVAEGMRLDYLPTRLFPARSQIVIVSPLARDDLPVLVSLRARGYQVMAVSPDPVTFEARALGPEPGLALATRIAAIERKLLLRQLWGAGIEVVDWQVERPLEEALNLALGGRARIAQSTAGCA